MTGPAKKRAMETASSALISLAQKYGDIIAQYESAVKTLQNTLGKETRPAIQEMVKTKTSKLEEHKIQYEKLVGSDTAGGQSTTVSFSDLAHVLSNEQKTREDLITFEKAGTYAQLKLELSDTEREVAGEEEKLIHLEVMGSDWCKCYKKISNLRVDIQLHAYKVEEDREKATQLIKSAYKAMIEATKATSRNIEIPGVGVWTKMSIADKASVPTDTKNTNQSPGTNTDTKRSPRKPSSALSLSEAKSSSSSSSSSSSNSNTTQTASKSTDKPPTITVNASTQTTPSTLTITQPRYQTIQKVPSDTFSVGDIGWLPLPRLSLCPSPSDIPSACGPIALKTYPFLIVKKLPDCMLGLVISTAGGNGLTRKPLSIRQRSTYVVDATSDVPTFPPSEKMVLNPVRVLRVKEEEKKEEGKGGYEPSEGAFVDMLDTFVVQYDGRFEKVGCLTRESVADLKRMRVSALMFGAMEG